MLAISQCNKEKSSHYYIVQITEKLKIFNLEVSHQILIQSELNKFLICQNVTMNYLFLNFIFCAIFSCVSCFILFLVNFILS